MSEITHSLLSEVLPHKQLKDMYMVDVQNMTLDAFKCINYHVSEDVHDALDKAWANSNREDSLVDFALKTWRFDNG